jgi:hypothetical protein
LKQVKTKPVQKTTKAIINHCVLIMALLAVSFFGCRRADPKPTLTDPLAGWQIDFKQPDAIVEKDCQDYMQKLPPEERKYANWGYYYKDATGQHAVVIEVDLKPNAWNHVLIYDKDNKRIKVIKYIEHQFRS